MSDSTAPTAGRFADPERTVLSDPRLDPRLRPLLAAAEQLAPALDTPALNPSYEDALRYCEAFEAAAAMTHPLEAAAMPDRPDVDETEHEIAGGDGQALTLFVHRPVQPQGPQPAILHTHGGGMAIMTAADPVFRRWRNELAHRGAIVVGVEFRNAGGKLGNHPFPAGLEDCLAAARWLKAQQSDWNLSGVIASGESGGGNLAIALTLAAIEAQESALIDGVYAFCPYVSGDYAEPPLSLSSLKENEGYVLSNEAMVALVRAYDPELRQARNPLAWPLHASDAQLAKLPPHVVSVNELDPLRDEGLLFYRRLLAAGVPVVGQTIHGTTHAADLAFPDVLPDLYADAAESVLAFARRCATQGG